MFKKPNSISERFSQDKQDSFFPGNSSKKTPLETLR